MTKTPTEETHGGRGSEWISFESVPVHLHSFGGVPYFRFLIDTVED